MATIHVIFFGVLAHTVAGALCIIIANFWIMVAYGEEIRRKFFELQTNYKIDKNSTKMKQELCEIVRFHSEVKE